MLEVLLLQVQKFINNANEWVDEVWKRVRDGRPKPLLMSVLVLRAYEIAYRMVQGDTSIATQ